MADSLLEGKKHSYTYTFEELVGLFRYISSLQKYDSQWIHFDGSTQTTDVGYGIECIEAFLEDIYQISEVRTYGIGIEDIWKYKEEFCKDNGNDHITDFCLFLSDKLKKEKSGD